MRNLTRSSRAVPLFLLAVLLFAVGCSEAGGQEVVNGRLGRKIQGILAGRLKRMPGATCGVKIYSLDDKETVYELNAGTLFSVASNMKIATTAAALARLGAEHRLTAKLYRRGDIESGVLKGDLVIVGLGDPNISGRFHGGDTEAVLDSWAHVLKSIGVDRVQGSIIADATAYGSEQIPPGWPQNQLEKWYCAPVSALSINDNCFDVTFGPGPASGKPAVVTLRPRAGVVNFTNECITTTNRKKQPILMRQAGTNNVTAKGHYWSGVKPRVYHRTVHNPPLVFISALKEALKRQGIGVTGALKVASKPVDTKKLIPVVEHSTLLSTAIAVTNKRSQNMHAELLLRELGRQAGKGTREGGIKAIVAFFEKIGIPKKQVSPADGCGLDRKTKLSPGAIVSLLAHMQSRSDFKIFMESLAVSGLDGTMKNRLNSAKRAGRVHAKTGYISGVSSLSGYAVSASGKLYAFSVIFNNAAKVSNTYMKAAQDEIVSAILDSK
jgi:D-alanyl-D-alanine carboxypeptidase/D-alanyl-D-alanine-endopeptidase (penicillin-binding protein 4)